MTDDVRAELAEVLAETQRHLMWLRDSNVRHLKRIDAPATAPRFTPPARPAPAGTERARPSFLAETPARPPPPRPPPVIAAPPPAPVIAAPPAATRPPSPMPTTPMTTPPSDALSALRLVRQDLGRCERCKLSSTRNTIVFGQGDPNAELVFVGEGPGEDEDLSGIPFVGKAGQLLTKMIEAMGYTRDDVYICNIVKCRPPNNRNPEEDEVEQCRPFVERQLLAIQPKVIVVLGSVAVKALLRTNDGVTKLRNHWQEWNGIPVMPTFHPSYLLREPAEKGKAWDDLKLVLAKLGKQPRR